MQKRKNVENCGELQQIVQSCRNCEKIAGINFLPLDPDGRMKARGVGVARDATSGVGGNMRRPKGANRGLQASLSEANGALGDVCSQYPNCSWIHGRLQKGNVEGAARDAAQTPYPSWAGGRRLGRLQTGQRSEGQRQRGVGQTPSWQAPPTQMIIK